MVNVINGDRHLFAIYDQQNMVIAYVTTEDENKAADIYRNNGGTVIEVKVCRRTYGYPNDVLVVYR